MSISFFTRIFAKTKNIFLNNHEKKFLKKSILRSNNNENGMAFLVTRDYRYLALFREISKNSNGIIYLILPTLYFPKTHHLILFFPFFFRKIYDRLIEKKWIKLYSAFSKNTVVIRPSNNIEKSLKLYKNSFQIWRSLNKKEDLVNFEFKGLQIGLIIYDNYIRFINKPTIKLKSISLLLQISKCLYNIEFYSSYVFSFNQDKFEYYTPYTSYISSGSIAFGLFLNRDERITIYTCSNPSYIIKFTKNHLRHTPEFKNYHQVFKSLSNKEKKLEEASQKFKKRFDGNNDLTYMKCNVYDNNDIELNDSYDGVMFLHDFMDAPHDYGKTLFNDFYEWTIETFEFILKNDLNIGVKFHPNQTRESNIVVNQLIEKYPKIKWINPEINNRKIFSSGIKFGFSVFSTVLSELAYHNITPMGCGGIPYLAYDFVYNCTSKDEYFNFLINPQKIDINKLQVLEFYYMNHIYNDSEVKLLDDNFLSKVQKEEVDLKIFV